MEKRSNQNIRPTDLDVAESEKVINTVLDSTIPLTSVKF